MSRPRLNILAAFLRKLQQHEPPPDQDLLQRFIERRDETAFELVVQRYGPLVRRVCRSVVHDDNDADDVFQATFLLLSKKAESLRHRDALGPWLHAVAFRLSQRVQRTTQRRRAHEARAEPREEGNTERELIARELRAAIHEELERLPDKYRIPLILYYLEDKNRNEITRELNLSLRTLTRRLECGRELLRARLKRFELGLGVALLFEALGPSAQAAVPRLLVVDTVRGALAFVRDGAVAEPTAAAAALARAALTTLFPTSLVQLKLVAVILGAGLAGAAGATWVLTGGPRLAIPASQPIAAVARSERAWVAPAMPLQDVPLTNKAGPRAMIVGRIIDVAGQPVAHAHVEALSRRSFGCCDLNLPDIVLTRGESDDQGAFRLTVPADFPIWLTERQVALLARAPGHVPVTTVVSLARDESKAVELRVPAPTQPLVGRLVASDGTAAAGVKLHVIRLGDVAGEPVPGHGKDSRDHLAWPGPFVTDRDGRFEAAGIGPAQGAWLQVDDERYAPDPFRLSDADVKEVSLRSAQVIEGRVVAADTNLPLAGIKVAAHDATDTSWRMSRDATAVYQTLAPRSGPAGLLDGVTGSDGQFRLRVPTSPSTQLEIQPPAGSPYLAIRTVVAWSEGTLRQTQAITLPRGVVVPGQVVDDADAPVQGASVWFYCPMRGNPTFRPDLVQDRQRLVQTGADGRFQLTVPLGPVSVCVDAPSLKFRPQPMRSWDKLVPEDPSSAWGWRDPRPFEHYYYVHAEQELDLSPSPLGGEGSGERGKSPSEVRLHLARGQTVAGRVLDPAGQPVKSAVLLCGEKASPVRHGAPLLLPVRQGRYELPGCVTGRVYPVYILDAEHGWAAKLDVPADNNPGPDIQLRPCGSVRARWLDEAGQPLAEADIVLFLWFERSFPTGHPADPRAADTQNVDTFDLLHYGGSTVKANADGWATLPALIPGARYQFFTAQTGRIGEPFTVVPGEQRQLPDIVAAPLKAQAPRGNQP